MNERDYSAIGRDQLIRENVQLHEQVTELQRKCTEQLEIIRKQRKLNDFLITKNLRGERI